MKTKPNKAIRELRKIIGKTQDDFAVMVGASKDAVVSWENGRNKLSEQFARRIGLATGVDEKPLLRGRGPLTAYVPFGGHVPFSAGTFARHRRTYWGRTDEEAARQHLANCVDALGLIFVAASRPERGAAYRLPGVLDSFRQWCERTRDDFRLGREIERELGRRRAKWSVNHTYKEWRRMAKEDPAMCRAMGFKDDPSKQDGENLRLEMETVPLWRPGYPMRGSSERSDGTAATRGPEI